MVYLLGLKLCVSGAVTMLFINSNSRIQHSMSKRSFIVLETSVLI